ncbi:MAG: hypothetical protein B7Z78_04475 [Rhodospirillales bacterium 20-60-12]|nr:MAG: hypothetical protein B7Z78_04475 [Rhodospirillales bacterium 20-60-12]
MAEPEQLRGVITPAEEITRINHAGMPEQCKRILLTAHFAAEHPKLLPAINEIGKTLDQIAEYLLGAVKYAFITPADAKVGKLDRVAAANSTDRHGAPFG